MTNQLIEAVFDRDKLANALTAVTVTQADSDLGWIQLHFVGDGKVVLSAVSHNLSVKCEFPAEYSSTGILKTSGKQLSDYVKALPPEKIHLTAELPQKISLRCGRSSARMQLVQDPTSTEIHVPHVGTCLKIKGESLQRWLDTFKDFVLVDDTRYYANGAYIWAEEKNGIPTLHAVVSDGLRLAQAELNDGIAAETLDTSAVLVPKKALDELRRMSAVEPGREFKLRWHQDSLFFAAETEDYAMISKCIAGKFPSYTSAIPQKINIESTIDTKMFLESVRRVLLFADKGKTIKLSFDGGVLNVQSATPGLKEGQEIIELQKSFETPLEVNYNGHLLTSILNVAAGSKINLMWKDANSPLKLIGEVEKGLDVFYLLVPTRF